MEAQEHEITFGEGVLEPFGKVELKTKPEDCLFAPKELLIVASSETETRPLESVAVSVRIGMADQLRGLSARTVSEAGPGGLVFDTMAPGIESTLVLQSHSSARIKVLAKWVGYKAVGAPERSRTTGEKLLGL